MAGESLLIRGATCALGYVAAQIAKALGCHVAGTTHRKEKFDNIRQACMDLDHHWTDGKIVIVVGDKSLQSKPGILVRKSSGSERNTA